MTELAATEPADESRAVAELSVARARVLERIAEACQRTGRPPADVTLVAVSKTVAIERLRVARRAGLLVFGENRVQEAAPKIDALPDVEWHLVGHLQSNKAARALDLFDVIESVDSLLLAQRLDRLVEARRLTEAREAESGQAAPPGRRLAVYLQINVDADPAKEGFTPDALRADLEALLRLPHVEIRGLMTVGWLAGGAEAARPTFVRLRELSEALRADRPELGSGLSMGMTDDFEVAVEEGSTLVRVGRALFAERPVPA